MRRTPTIVTQLLASGCLIAAKSMQSVKIPGKSRTAVINLSDRCIVF